MIQSIKPQEVRYGFDEGWFHSGTDRDCHSYVMDILFRFTSSFGVFNVGLCIILFTIVMKTLMMPLTIKQQKTTKLMSVMNPEIQAIQKEV